MLQYNKLKEQPSHSAFSLIELSIVLVILGLLVGGVLSGQALIRAAQLRKVATTLTSYQAAMNAFRDRYFALPGDMPNATSFWGALGGGGQGSGCFTVESSDTKTCDGNGDGFISHPASSSGTWLWGERFHVWLHLANAGLIQGRYTGRTDSNINSFVFTAGKNVPSGSEGVLYDMYSEDLVADSNNPYYFVGMTMRTPFIATRVANGWAFTPEEQWNIDTKLDDGKPGSGKIMSTKFSLTPCATSDNPTTATYNLSVSDHICAAFVYMY